MARPNITLGSLNRTITSLLFPNFANLSITPPFTTQEAIEWAPEGQATIMLPTMTGLVTSPEPYMSVRVTCHLVRSIAFADAWKQQWELSTLLGPATVRPDSPTLTPFQLQNVAIVGLDRMAFAGRDASMVVVLMGAYPINSAIWN